MSLFYLSSEWHNLSILGSVCGKRVAALILVVFVKMCSLARWCIMVREFAVRPFCGRFLYGEMAAWVIGQIEALVSFWMGYLIG